MICFASRGDFCWPPSQHGHTYTSFVQITLITLEGTIAIEEIRVCPTLYMGTVVGSKDHEGIIGHAQGFEFIQYLSHLVVKQFYHSSKSCPRIGLGTISTNLVSRMFR